MQLNRENYFSKEANKFYMSVSQFKDFVPAFGGCEQRAMARLQGEYEQVPRQAFIEGHYMHSWNSNELEEFMYSNPDLYSTRGKTAGQLKANFKHCNHMIEVLENDPLVMKALAGQKEVIFTGELFGIPWKVMIDSYQPETNMFADLKTMRELSGKFWSTEHNCYENFIEHFGYDVQMSVYAEVERKANNRENWLIPHIVAVTKQAAPDHEIMYFDYDLIQSKLLIVSKHIERVKKVKSGEVEPVRCDTCEYCRLTKKLKEIKHYSAFALY